MTFARALALAAVAALFGCSSLAPYATAPPSGKAAPGTRVAVCYDGFAGSRAAARARAQRECPAHTAANYLGTDLRLNHCPLLLPARATFLCAPQK